MRLLAHPTEAAMTEIDYNRKLDEIDRLLNDPEVPMEPARVWSLLSEIAARDASTLVLSNDG